MKQGMITEAELRNNIKPLIYTRMKLGTTKLSGEVVAQLVECSSINLLACASMGAKPVTATLCR